MKKIIRLTESDLVKLVKRVINEGTDNKGGFALIFAFPDYEIKGYGGETVTKKISRAYHDPIRTIKGGGEKGSYGRLGHAGVALVDGTGNTSLYEFGRYGTKQGEGRVIKKNLGKIGKVSEVSGTLYGTKLKLTNARDVSEIVKRNTEGVGPSLRMVVAVVRLPNYKGSYDFANSVNVAKYNEIDVAEGGGMNCGTFANDVVNAGGITNINPICSPYPERIIKSFYWASDEYFDDI